MEPKKSREIELYRSGKICFPTANSIMKLSREIGRRTLWGVAAAAAGDRETWHALHSTNFQPKNCTFSLLAQQLRHHGGKKRKLSTLYINHKNYEKKYNAPWNDSFKNEIKWKNTREKLKILRSVEWNFLLTRIWYFKEICHFGVLNRLGFFVWRCGWKLSWAIKDEIRRKRVSAVLRSVIFRRRAGLFSSHFFCRAEKSGLNHF